MGNGGKSGKKRIQTPPVPRAGGKRTGNPSSLLPGADNSNDRLCWRFTHVDHEGPWGFDKVEPPVLCEILQKLADCESMTLNELRNSRRLFKEYDVPGGLCAEAINRLEAMGRDDQTKIQRLEFKGTWRLYGLLEGNVFHVVWWDPNHEVYPSRLRNT